MYLSSDALVSPVRMEAAAASRSPAAPMSCPSPRTPPNTTPNSANRRLVRPLLQQRKKTIQHVSQAKTNVQGACHLPASARNPEEPVALQEGIHAGVSNTTNLAAAAPSEPDATSGPATSGESIQAPTIGGPTGETVASSSPSVVASSLCATGGDGDVLVLHCPPLRSSHTNTLSLRATQPHMKRINAGLSVPVLLPRTDTPMSLASYPSNLSSSARANTSSANSSFSVISSASKHGGPSDAPVPPHTASSTSTYLLRRQQSDGVVAEGVVGGELRPLPPLLRSSLSAHTLRDEASRSSASSYAARPQLSGVAGASSRLRVMGSLGPVPPHLRPSSATSLTSGTGTPLSSTRSSARPSFLRTVLPSPLKAAKSAVDKAAAAAAVTAVPEPGSAQEVQALSTKEVCVRTVNGRVLSSPLGARRPEFGPRRTTFGRTSSAASLTDSPASTATAGPTITPSIAASGVGAAGERDGSAEVAMAREMRSFVLGQYRTLQREVRTLPAAAEKPTPTAASSAAQAVDVTATDFVHVKRCSCPWHSKAARRAEVKRQEEERLRAVQQQHHDMAVIRNGGREEVGVNMKSSTMLAGSLSRLRSRNKWSVHGGSGSGADRICSSLDRTISAAFESEESPFGSADEVEVTTLYGASPFPYSSPEQLKPPQSADSARASSGMLPVVAAQISDAGEAEAWHASRFFMAAAPTPAQERRNTRTVNKNGMKGEAIVVAVVPDSDEEREDTVSESEMSREGRLRHTKGVAASGSSVRDISSGASWQTAAPSQQLREVAASAVTTAGATRRGSTDHNPTRSDSISSDDDACYSFNKLRTQRFRSNTTHSLSSSQTLGQKSLSTALPLPAPQTSAHSPQRVVHRAEKMLSPSKASTSSSPSNVEKESEDEGDVEACCSCCPCKKPEYFFALCRTGSRSGSFVTPGPEQQEPEHDSGGSPTYVPREAKEVSGLACQAENAASLPPRSVADGSAGPGSRVVLEDLEAVRDDDEPLLSMQSFRRTSIQRVR